MQALCGIAAVVMAGLWINWVLATVLVLVEPSNAGRWLSFALATIVTAPVLYGGLRLLDSQSRA